MPPFSFGSAPARFGPVGQAPGSVRPEDPIRRRAQTQQLLAAFLPSLQSARFGGGKRQGAPSPLGQPGFRTAPGEFVGKGSPPGKARMPGLSNGLMAPGPGIQPSGPTPGGAAPAPGGTPGGGNPLLSGLPPEIVRLLMSLGQQRRGTSPEAAQFGYTGGNAAFGV
jgi:hypothetical protein